MNISYFYTCKGIFPRELLKWSLHTQKFSHPNKIFNIRTYCDKKPSIPLSGWRRYKLSTTRNYVTALGLLTLAGAYAAVPLYRIFCQASGYGGTTRHDLGGEKIESMVKKPYRKVLVTFTSDVSTELQWNFEPQQRALEVVPGETALAFYTATNPLDKPVIGISTYNVLPFEAGPYFNKIQCFCFEEQQLNPKEQVDMPVFFYIDPEFCEDPAMENVNEIILSYTFFQAKEGMSFDSLFSKTKN